jgi:hypothetical protein
VSLTDWIQLLDFGLREAILKFAAAHQARADAPAVRRLADAALWLYVVASGLSLVVGLGLVRWVLPALIPVRGGPARGAAGGADPDAVGGDQLPGGRRRGRCSRGWRGST